jgi:hypothetical protein
MTGALKRKLMIGVAVLALLVGTVLAIVTASGSSEGPSTQPPIAGAVIDDTRPSGDLAIAANYIGIPGAQLRSDLLAGSTLAEIANSTAGRSAAGLMDALFAAKAEYLSKAVSTGRLSKSKQASKLAKLPERLATEIHRHHGVSVGPVDRATAARYLGLSVSQIGRELRSGNSLARIASERPGKTTAGLVCALMSAKEAALAHAAYAGTLSRGAQRARIATLARLVSTEVEHSPPKRTAGNR